MMPLYAFNISHKNESWRVESSLSITAAIRKTYLFARRDGFPKNKRILKQYRESKQGTKL